MATDATKSVFVVYGRNIDAYREMKKFLAHIGVVEESFEQVANKQSAPYVTEIIIQGIQLASAVIVMFTPDELAVLHESSDASGSKTGIFRESRWQARPNVIFEAGIAFGLKRNRTVLVALGRDVAGFSDIGGVHIVHLDSDAGKVSLRERLQSLLGNLPSLKADWHKTPASGDFTNCVPQRWAFFDELESLERFLAAKCLVLTRETRKTKANEEPRGSYSLLQIIKRIVTREPRDWTLATPRDLIELINSSFDDEVAEDATRPLAVRRSRA